MGIDQYPQSFEHNPDDVRPLSQGVVVDLKSAGKFLETVDPDFARVISGAAAADLDPEAAHRQGPARLKSILGGAIKAAIGRQIAEKGLDSVDIAKLEKRWGPLDDSSTASPELVERRAEVKKSVTEVDTQRLEELFSKFELSDDEWLEAVDLIIRAPEGKGSCMAPGCGAHDIAGARGFCRADALAQLSSPTDEELPSDEETDEDLEKLARQLKELLRKHYAGKIKTLPGYEKIIELMEKIILVEAAEKCTQKSCERPIIEDCPHCVQHNYYDIVVAWRNLTEKADASQKGWGNGQQAA